jgi:hypothetical protein
MEVVWKRVTARNGAQFVRHVVPAVMKPARVLWNEIIGFLFLCFTVIFGFQAGRHVWNWLYPDPSLPADGPADLGRFLIAAFCTSLTGYFAVTSFWRARKISRS